MIDQIRARSARHDPDDNGALKALRPIETVGADQPYQIVPIDHVHGSAVDPLEVMAGKVKWARKAGYRIVTRDVPPTFAPYNAVIRIDEIATEDQHRDYLAHLEDAPSS